MLKSICFRVVQDFGFFKSGIGVHYADSVIVVTKNQAAAKNIVIGRRLPSEIIICAADDRPVQLHDLLRADMRFKFFVFTGDLSNPKQNAMVKTFADKLSSGSTLPMGFLANKESIQIFDIFTVVLGKKGEVKYLDVPHVLRSHWSKCVQDLIASMIIQMTCFGVCVTESSWMTWISLKVKVEKHMKIWGSALQVP